MDSKYYIRSVDNTREVVLSAPSLHAALVRLWTRELELLRRIPAECVKFIDLDYTLFDPVLLVDYGRGREAFLVPTAPILSSFDEGDKSVIVGIMRACWFGVDELAEFEEQANFFWR